MRERSRVPISPERYEKLIAQGAIAHRAARRDTLRDLLRAIGHIAFWVVCGLVLFAWAFHVTDRSIGMILWWAAHAVWIAGVAFSVLAAYRRGEKRGDW